MLINNLKYLIRQAWKRPLSAGGMMTNLPIVICWLSYMFPANHYVEMSIVVVMVLLIRDNMAFRHRLGKDPFLRMQILARSGGRAPHWITAVYPVVTYGAAYTMTLTNGFTFVSILCAVVMVQQVRIYNQLKGVVKSRCACGKCIPEDKGEMEA